MFPFAPTLARFPRSFFAILWSPLVWFLWVRRIECGRGFSSVKGNALYFFIVISTRRFFCRPSGSSEPSGFLFGATGLAAPQPRVCIEFAGAPCFENQFLTDTARRSDSFTL